MELVPGGAEPLGHTNVLKAMLVAVNPKRVNHTWLYKALMLHRPSDCVP